MAHLKSATRQEFEQVLEPFFIMFEEREMTLPREQWKAMVDQTKERIISAPEQYLPGYVIPSAELTATVETIFKDRLN